MTPSEEGTRSCSTLSVKVSTQTNQHTRALTHFFRKRFCSLWQLTGSKPTAHECQTRQSYTCLTPTPGGQDQTLPPPPTAQERPLRRQSSGLCISSLHLSARLSSGCPQTWVVVVASSHCNDQQSVWGSTAGPRQASLREGTVKAAAEGPRLWQCKKCSISAETFTLHHSQRLGISQNETPSFPWVSSPFPVKTHNSEGLWLLEILFVVMGGS